MQAEISEVSMMMMMMQLLPTMALATLVDAYRENESAIYAKVL